MERSPRATAVVTSGTEGCQADVKGVGGMWKDLTDSVNFIAGNRTSQVRNIAEVSTAIASGDLSKKITVDVKREIFVHGVEPDESGAQYRSSKHCRCPGRSFQENHCRCRGEILELKDTVNIMVDQLHSFAWEVTRVVRSIHSVKAFVDRQMKRLLVVEDDDRPRKAIVDLIGDADIETTAVSTGEEALRSLGATRFDCMVIDLGLSGFEVLETLNRDPDLYDLPVIVYSAKELSPDEQKRLRKMAESIIIKDARSPERLLGETPLFPAPAYRPGCRLHNVVY